ncbi:hypothetical protein QQF64_034385, partial [Cirrhinus molitorella]
MAARAQREAQRLSSFCSFAVILLLISGLFVQNSCALTSYTRQELLDISLRISDSFINNLHLAPEIAKTTEAAHTTRPGGSARRRRRDLNDCKHREHLKTAFDSLWQSLQAKEDKYHNTYSFTQKNKIMEIHQSAVILLLVLAASFTAY